MSTLLVNRAGAPVAERRNGGADLGAIVEVMLPFNTARDVQNMLVHEETSARLTTLGEWLTELADCGYRIFFKTPGRAVPKEARSGQA